MDPGLKRTTFSRWMSIAYNSQLLILFLLLPDVVLLWPDYLSSVLSIRVLFVLMPTVGSFSGFTILPLDEQGLKNSALSRHLETFFCCLTCRDRFLLFLPGT